MKLKRVLLSIVLSVVNPIINLRPIKSDKITIISLEGNELKDDLLLIERALKDKYRITEVLYEFKKNTVFTSAGYFINCLKQVWHISNSKLVILSDNNFVISRYKRSGVKVMQVWHANGAIKRFGNEVNRRYKIANYDYILSNGDYWKEIYGKAFGVKEEQIYTTGLPKVDILFNEEILELKKKEFYEKYPHCRGKKIILYAPTFRGNIYEGIEPSDESVSKIMNSLDDEYLLLHKMHPLADSSRIYNKERELDVSHEDLYQLLIVSDMLISDYSSIIFDYSLLKKPILLYVPDLNEYSERVGLFLNYEEIPGDICDNVETLIESIKSQPKVMLGRNKYFDHLDGKNTERAVQLIDEIMETKY